jgi:uracil-DNA glycosylase
MLNRATADLESATVRIRLFGGRSAGDVATDYPMAPVNTPAIPPPGPGISAQALAMGDPPPEIPTGTKKRVAARSNGTWLTALVRSLLYQPDTTVLMDDVAVPFQPGVLDDGASRFGPGPCRLMVVGKCLGRTEVLNRKPFCGFGSKELWKAWTAARLPNPGTRLPTYLTNLAPYELLGSAAGQALSKDAVADGKHLLWHQFAVCRPEVVLLLGSDAVKAVLGRSVTISGYRGRVGRIGADFRPTADAPADPWTAAVVTADHPAAVGRDPDITPQFVAALQLVSRTLGFLPHRPTVPVDYQSVYTTAELEVAVRDSERASAKGGYIAFDCEWEGHHPSDPGSFLYTVQWSHAPGHARVVFLKRCGGAPNPGLPPEGFVPLLDRLMRRAPERGARLVGHFAKGDLKWLHSVGIDLYDVYVGDRDGDTYTKGAFDTYTAAHAVDELRIKQLEVMAATDFEAPRYDVPMDEWKAAYCKEKKIPVSALKGYGNCPEGTIINYAAADSDYAGREYLHHNGDPRTGTKGLLDADAFGLSSRQIFAVRMRAWAAMAEMERYGLEVDLDRHRVLREEVRDRREALLAEFRSSIGWPEFDPAKTAHTRELLFGEKYSKDGSPVGPATCRRLYLTPYKSTKKTGSRLWADADARYRAEGGETPTPATDKETLINLARTDPTVLKLLDIGTLGTALKVALRPPDLVADDEEEDEPTEEHTKGLLAYLRGDGRIDTMLGLVETGRYSSGRPNLQNVSDAVDEKLNRIMQWGDAAPAESPNAKKRLVTRSTFRAKKGWYLADADLNGAEILAAAVNSEDRLLLEHARRNGLKESDPEWLDLHSDLAMSAFSIRDCTPAEFRKRHKPLRVASKRTRFGHYYGASAETIHRQCLLENPDVTLEQVRRVVEGHDALYPTLADYFARARARVRKGWLRNGYGGTRRFRSTDDREIQAGYERAAQNWTCQGLVADHISEALGKLWYALRDQGLQSRIVLAIHDSIVMECPPAEIAFVVDELLPWAMGWGTPITPTDLTGRPTGKGPYFFGISCKVCRTWGVNLPDAEWRADAAHEAALAV